MKFPANKNKNLHPAVIQIQDFIKKALSDGDQSELLLFEVTPEMLDFFNFPPSYKYIHRMKDLEETPDLNEIKDVIFRNRLKNLYNYESDEMVQVAATLLNAVYHSILNTLPSNLSNNIVGLIGKTKEELVKEARSSLKLLKMVNDDGSPNKKEMEAGEEILRHLMANPKISQQDVVDLASSMTSKQKEY